MIFYDWWGGGCSLTIKESILGLRKVSMSRGVLNYNEYPNFRQFPWRY